MAVQNSGLQDLIDPAQAGRGTVPASGLATFDLLALTGAGGTDDLVTIGNYKELSSLTAASPGEDVSGDDFAEAIDTLVATGLLLKEGVAAKPFIAPEGRAWVLSVTVPEVTSEDADLGVKAISNMSMLDTEFPAPVSEMSVNLTGTFAIELEVLEMPRADMQAVPAATEILMVPEPVSDDLEVTQSAGGHLPVELETDQVTPVVLVQGLPTEAEIAPDGGGSIEPVQSITLPDLNDTGSIVAAVQISRAGEAKVVTPNDRPDILVGANDTGSIPAAVQMPRAGEAKAVAPNDRSDVRIDGLRAQTENSHVPDADETLVALQSGDEDGPPENEKANVEAGDVPVDDGFVLNLSAVTGSVPVVIEQKQDDQAGFADADENLTDRVHDGMKWKTSTSSEKAFASASSGGGASDRRELHDQVPDEADQPVSVSAEAGFELGGITRNMVPELRSAPRSTEPDLAKTRLPDGQIASGKSDRIPHIAEDQVSGLVQSSSPFMQELAARARDRSADAKKSGSRHLTDASSEMSAGSITDGDQVDGGASSIAQVMAKHNHERHHHDRREERQAAAFSSAQQKAIRADEEMLRADVESAIDRLEVTVSTSQNRQAMPAMMAADGKASPAQILAAGDSSSADSRTDVEDSTRFSLSPLGGQTFFGVPQPIMSEQVLTARRSTGQDAIVAEMRNRAIERQVLTALKNDKTEITMSLFPSHLGEVVIKLSMDGQKVRLGFKAANREAKEALIESEATLKDALANSGLVLASLDISADTDARSSQRDATEPTKQFVPAQDMTAAFSINRLA
jgi:flagellar hook-length control protein FliK